MPGVPGAATVRSVRLCLLAMLSGALILSCAPQQESVRLAALVDYTTSQAHLLLRVAFAESVLEEDDADLILLEHVKLLDQVDDDLAEKVARFEDARSGVPDIDLDAARQEVVRNLNEVEAHYATVAHLFRQRPIHDSIRVYLARVPPLLTDVRQQLASPRQSL